MSIRSKLTLLVAFSTAAVLLINNTYFALRFTGFTLLEQDLPMLAIFVISILVMGLLIYLVSGSFTSPIKVIRNVLSQILERQPIVFPHKPNDEIGQMMKEIEKVSSTLIERDREVDEKQQELLVWALTDPVTEMPNREYFFNLLKRREKESAIFITILITDILRINALKGIEFTDKLLVETANRIRSVMPDDALIGRMSTNQFSVYLPSTQNETVQLKNIQPFREALAEEFNINGESLYIQCAYGISQTNSVKSKSPEEYVHLADLAAMEKQGELSSNIYISHEYLHKEYDELLRMEGALRNAALNRDFQVVYQPIVNLHKPVISLETLVRWEYEGQWIPPSNFIPMIESLGYIVDLTLQVVEQSARDWKEWKRHLPDLSHISINISPLIFDNREDCFLKKVMAILEKYQVPPQVICFEITENALLQKTSEDFIEQCSNYGFSIAIDDFGSGYSSMAYIAHYPFNVLKIDRSLILQLETNSKQKEVASAIVQLAKRLDLHVVAEGVETKEQLRILYEMGVDAVQGFYFSKPQFLNDWNPSGFEERRKELMFY